jgi:hypothetical protein
MDRTPVPSAKINELCNRDESRVKQEVYDVYAFLHRHPSMAENRCIDVLRAAIASTPFVYAFSGLVTVAAAALIDERLAAGDGTDPCAELQRDHFIPWRDTGRYFFHRELLPIEEFWPEMKRRNEVALLHKREHHGLAGHQRAGHGHDAYQLTGLQLVQVDKRAIVLSGQRAKLIRDYWLSPKKRKSFAFPTPY